jgi:hypothetical protein
MSQGNKEEFSPIEKEVQRIANRLRLEGLCGTSYQVCTECGQKGQGFSNMMEGTFTCVRCYMKKKAEELDSDPEWIRKEKVWKMRKAREVWNSKLTLIDMTQSEKEQLARKIYDHMLQ